MPKQERRFEGVHRRHRDYDPFATAPRWAVELRKAQALILQQIGKIMVTQAELDAKLDELGAAVQKELQQLVDAIATSAPDLTPQAEKIQKMIDALVADDPAAAPPATP